MRTTTPLHLNRRQTLLALLGTALLPACGGGSNVAGVSTGGTGSYTSGVIVGLGSIIVNGIRFDDSTASVLSLDGSSSAAALKLGMVVRVQGSAITPVTVPGSLPTATATRIQYGSEWKGQVAGVDTTVGTFTLLGQTVHVTATTVIEGAGGAFGSALNGRYVEVYGFVDPSDGSLRASRIEVEDSAPDRLRLSGLVRGLDTTATTFQLGSAIVVYSGASEVPAGLANGLLVRVDLLLSPNGSGQWVATRVRTEDAASDLDDDDEAEIEGLVTNLTGTRFVLNGIPVDASRIGLPVGLAEGDRVEVKGTVLNGTVVAEEIDIESEDEPDALEYEFHGVVSLLDTIAKTFSIRGYTVHYDDATAFEPGVVPLANDLRVEVKARLDNRTGQWLATRIEADD